MYPATCLRIRNPLYPVYTTFKFQSAIYIITYYFYLYFFITTCCSFTFTQ